MNVLVINPGSTSTKLAYYKGDTLVTSQSIDHPSIISKEEDIQAREQLIYTFLENNNIVFSELDGVVGRGGILPPAKAGAYKVNEAMLRYLIYDTPVEHPSNYGAILADKIAHKADVEAYIYDCVTVDELDRVSRITGLKEITKKSMGHTLNSRAAAIKVAKESYTKKNIIVAHLGGGNTVSLHSQGRIINLISDDEGPFSMERTGGLPLKDIINLCYEFPKNEVMKLYKKTGGFISYSGSNDMRTIEEEILKGNEELALVREAYILQIAQAIGSLAPMVNGNIDYIILTGGVAYSKYITQAITDKVEYISSVSIIPGENEMEALNSGIQRILKGLENSHTFKIEKEIV